MGLLRHSEPRWRRERTSGRHVRLGLAALLGLSLAGCGGGPGNSRGLAAWGLDSFWGPGTFWGLGRPRLELRVPAVGGEGSAIGDEGDPYQRGKGHLLAGRLGLAVAELQIALDRAEDDVDVLNGLAVAYAELGRDELAARHFQRALLLAPNEPATYNNIGYAAFRQGRLDLARLYLDRAAALAGGEERVAANLAFLAAAEAGRGSPAPVGSVPESVRPRRLRVQRVDPRVQRILTVGDDAEGVDGEARLGEDGAWQQLRLFALDEGSLRPPPRPSPAPPVGAGDDI